MNSKRELSRTELITVKGYSFGMITWNTSALAKFYTVLKREPYDLINDLCDEFIRPIGLII